MTKTSTVFIGLGSNLGDSQTILQQATQAIADIPKTQHLKTSRFYQTAPVGPIEQDDFLNAVIAIETQLNPSQLLAQLQAIENHHGRQRHHQIHWGPRTLDLDILLFGKTQYRDRHLIIPHPELLNRAFVLVPLREIAPNLILPNGCKIASHPLAKYSALAVTVGII